MATNPIQFDGDHLGRSGSLPPSGDEHGRLQSNDLSQEYGTSFFNDASYQENFNAKSLTTSYRLKPPNDVHLIRKRKIHLSHKTRKDLELKCEEKSSKYRLEESHTSLPSSVKSTLIMTFSPDNQRVASTHGDHRIYICDLNTGRLLNTLEGHSKTPWCLAWHPSNREILASGCLAGEVRVWDLKSRACEFWSSTNNSIITSLNFHPKERVLVIATANEVLFWDWSESEPFAKTTTLHEREKVKLVAFDSTGTKLITGISNLPKYAECSSDSLQSRIIDGYLSPRSIEVSTENMPQSNEVVVPNPNYNAGTNQTHETVNEESNFMTRRLNTNNNAGSNSNAGSNGGSNGNSMNNEQDNYYRTTMMLSRIAFLYRQLEALEDSMRHTSFLPLSRPVVQQVESREKSESVGESSLVHSTGSLPNGDGPNDQLSSGANEQSSNCNSISSNLRSTSSNETDQQQYTRDTHASNTGRPSNITAEPAPNSFESYLVAFDESLEQLQLPPLLLDGLPVNIPNNIEQYPIDLSYQLNYAMQFESINQVSQNFIRISKLMSSARLYRETVQQILSGNSGNTPHPNQILTIQSVSPRARISPNTPIVLRTGTYLGPTGNRPMARPSDPLVAIQFRDTARNVPLATICKIDLLAARALCILRSQVIVDHLITSNRLASLTGLHRPIPMDARSSGEDISNSSNNRETFNQIMSQMHSILIQVKHAPLTTSNAYAHIASLRVISERLFKMLSTTLNSSTESRRLNNLIHSIAFSLTGRKWSMPLGATLDEIRLDVIHTLCIVDMTLHIARQIQLVQMQRISIVSRVDESSRPIVRDLSSEPQVPTRIDVPQDTTIVEPPPARSSNLVKLSSSSNAVHKRKDRSSSDYVKRRKIECSTDLAGRAGGVMVKEVDNISPNEASSSNSNTVDYDGSSPSGSSENHVSSVSVPSAERLVLWNTPQSQIDQNLQRFLVTTTPSLSNNHILIRIYHRLQGNNVYPIHPSIPGILDQPIERTLSAHYESRRRALSQDHSSEIPNSPAPGTSSEVNDIPGPHRARIRPPTVFQVSLASGQNQHYAHAHPNHVSGGIVIDPWLRHPHLHVYQARGVGQHLWYNQWTVPYHVNSYNYRLQCWNFSLNVIPSIKDPQRNMITPKCRIQNDASIDLSRDGNSVACFVPRDDIPTCSPCFDLKIFSLRRKDFGSCYYRVPIGQGVVSVSLSPSGTYAVVGFTGNKFIHSHSEVDDLKIAKIFKFGRYGSFEMVRDVKIKRDDSSLSLNAIRWMSRGIVYNVGPNHHQRYRMRNMMAP